MRKRAKIILAAIALFILILIGWKFISVDSLKSLASILGHIGEFVVKTIDFLGYPGIAVLMALESMIFPMPSELVMPFAGFLAVDGKMSFWLIILFSSIGSIIGSLISYYIGYYGGNKFILKFGKYFLLDVTDLDKTERWFHKKGEKTIFISRFVPVVRHLISIPAGIGKMDLKKFCFYTIVGATMWNSILAYAGYVLGKNWELVRHYSEYASMVAAVLILVASAYFVHHHYRNKMKERMAREHLAHEVKL
ncbi:MAG: DedA family protein [Candidatus Woesearchaeota archaeon]